MRRTGMALKQFWPVASVAVVQSGLAALLLAMVSPLRALAIAVAIPGALVVLLAPRLGVYGLAATLIGQWPWNGMRYFGILVVASALAWQLLRRQRVLPPNPILLLMGLFVVFVLLSTISPRSRIGMRSMVLTYLGHFTLVWLFAILIDSRQAVQTVIRVMVSAGVIVAIIGLVQWRTHFVWAASTTAVELSLASFADKTGMDLQGWLGTFRIDSITGTPDLYALYMQTLMPFVIFWTVRQRSLIRWLGGGLILGLLGVTHLLSFTRGALVTTGLVLFLVGWMLDRRRLIACGPVLILVGCVTLLAWSPLRQRVLSMLTFKPAPGVEAHLESGKWRLAVLPYAFRMLLENPITGIGVEQTRYHWPDEAKHLIPSVKGLAPVELHQSYLKVGIELGWGGLAVFLLLIFTTLQRLYWVAGRFQALGDRQLADTARAMLAAFIGLVFALLMYPMLETFRYFWLLLGLTGSLLHLEKSLLRHQEP